jgi:hypothetical protein
MPASPRSVRRPRVRLSYRHPCGTREALRCTDASHPSWWTCAAAGTPPRLSVVRRVQAHTRARPRHAPAAGLSSRAARRRVLPRPTLSIREGREAGPKFFPSPLYFAVLAAPKIELRRHLHIRRCPPRQCTTELALPLFLAAAFPFLHLP